MRPLRRGGLNKGRSVRKFRRQASRTKGMNIWTGPMRGGIRL